MSVAEQGVAVFCECYVLSCRGVCNGPILHPEQFYHMYVCVTECDQVQQEPSTPTVSRQTRSD